MSETKFTPGPWDDASKYPNVRSVRIFAGVVYVATIGGPDDPSALEANAALIAAAPDLYAALEKQIVLENHRIGCKACNSAEPWHCQEAVRLHVCALDARRDALKKARGDA